MSFLPLTIARAALRLLPGHGRTSARPARAPRTPADPTDRALENFIAQLMLQLPFKIQ